MEDQEITIVYLNDKLIRTLVAFNEEEGWVEIPDISAMAPLDLDSSIDDTMPEEWKCIPVKRLYGNVRVVKV